MFKFLKGNKKVQKPIDEEWERLLTLKKRAEEDYRLAKMAFNNAIAYGTSEEEFEVITRQLTTTEKTFFYYSDALYQYAKEHNKEPIDIGKRGFIYEPKSL